MSEHFKRILVPVDGSTGSNHAAHWAAKMARALDAEVTLLFVVPMSGIQWMGVHNLDKAELERHGRGVASEAMAGARSVLSESTVKVAEEIVFGDPATEIINVAGKEGFALVVMGSRGLSPFKELVLGSVSDKVVRHAPVPVTIVH